MQKMADTNPLVMHYPIGTSYEGRNISMVTVRVPDGQIRPVVMLECGIHAREWVAPASCIWIFHQLASGYGIDDEVTELLNAYDWIIVPSTNPDGYEYNWSRVFLFIHFSLVHFSKLGTLSFAEAYSKF